MKLAALLVLSLATVAHADPEPRVATATQYDGPPGGELDAPPVQAERRRRPRRRRSSSHATAPSRAAACS